MGRSSGGCASKDNAAKASIPSDHATTTRSCLNEYLSKSCEGQSPKAVYDAQRCIFELIRTTPSRSMPKEMHGFGSRDPEVGR